MSPSYEAIYAATFGAMYAQQVADYKAKEGYLPGRAVAEQFAEEAETVAHEAVEALDRFLREKFRRST